MASITTAGMNLDVQGLAKQLVAADRAAQDARLSRQEQSLTVQMSGLVVFSEARTAYASMSSSVGSPSSESSTLCCRSFGAIDGSVTR